MIALWIFSFYSPFEFIAAALWDRHQFKTCIAHPEQTRCETSRASWFLFSRRFHRSFVCSKMTEWLSRGHPQFHTDIKARTNSICRVRFLEMHSTKSTMKAELWSKEYASSIAVEGCHFLTSIAGYLVATHWVRTLELNSWFSRSASAGRPWTSKVLH